MPEGPSEAREACSLGPPGAPLMPMAKTMVVGHCGDIEIAHSIPLTPRNKLTTTPTHRSETYSFISMVMVQFRCGQPSRNGVIDNDRQQQSNRYLEMATKETKALRYSADGDAIPERKKRMGHVSASSVSSAVQRHRPHVQRSRKFAEWCTANGQAVR